MRTTDAYTSMAALFVLWFAATLFYLFVSLRVDSKSPGDQQPLNVNHDNPPDEGDGDDVSAHRSDEKTA